MKTIDKAAKLAYENELIDEMCNAGETFGLEMFKRGVEFAQQWIPVEEGVPKNETEIIAKNDYWKEVFVFYLHGLHNAYYLKTFTHWRPIELK